MCLIGSAQEVSEESVLNVLNFCFMFPFFRYFLFYYIYENLCVVFLGFGLSIISHIFCPLLDHGLRMKYRVPIRP